jgi:hypothetical protein
MLDQCPEAATFVCHSSGSLPIHAALRNSAPDMVSTVNHAARRLLSVYPGAADQGDASGFLPLHLLVSRPSPDLALFQRLLEIYPLATEISTHSDDTFYYPLHCAMMAPRPSKAIIEALLSAYPEASQARCAAGLTPVDYLFLNLKRRRDKSPSKMPSLVCSAVDGNSIQNALSQRNGSPDSVVSSSSASSPCGTAGDRSPTSSGNELKIKVESDSQDKRDYMGRSWEPMSPGKIPAAGTSGVNIASYFSGRPDEDILRVAIELLDSNDYSVTDDILQMFGARLSAVVESSDEMSGFPLGSRPGENMDTCQCVVQ